MVCLSNLNQNKLEKYYFKHIWTGDYVYLILNSHLKISELKNQINQSIMKDLKINDNYEIISVGQSEEINEPLNLNLDNKLYTLNNTCFYIRPLDVPISHQMLRREEQRINRINRINLSSRNILSNLPISSNNFTNSNRVIIGISITNLECGICYQNYSLVNFTPWKNCFHYENCCINCINNWTYICNKNRKKVSCPICRNNII